MKDLIYNTDQLWSEFLSAAITYFENQEEYFSPIQEAVYRVTEIKNQVIHVHRQKAITSNTIGRGLFNTAIERILSYGKVIPKGELYSPVIIETTLVTLLPFLDWSADGKFILVGEGDERGFSNSSILEAENDDINDKRLRSINLRKGQTKFRNAVKKYYGVRCVISKCSIEEVLHACHISPHYISGDNISTNGFLLRADLHELFDSNLIAIHPETLVVSVSSKLKDSIYWEYNGVKIIERSDKKKPNTQGLNERWSLYSRI